LKDLVAADHFCLNSPHLGIPTVRRIPCLTPQHLGTPRVPRV
jgi:hypothetical protein